MLGLITAFLVSFAITLLIIRTKHLHKQFSGDSDFSGPQKFHQTSVPRIGGISIAGGLFAAILIKAMDIGLENPAVALLLCAIPTFAIGLTEDLTKKIGVRQRLLFTTISALCAIYLLGLQITKLDIVIIDFLFTLPLFGVLLTVVAITGLANAYNIIDGFNGLSSMVGIITLLALSYIAFIVGDTAIIFLALVMAGAIFGFFIWNYPQGLIFLGDGGAYLIGFWIAALSIWLCARHPEVSPWFALLINGYPIMETLFTIYRRKIHQGKSPGLPDGIHFHTLIYRRILLAKHDNSALAANARTAPYLWILAALCIIPAVLWWQSTPILMGACALFMVSYVWLYTQIVQFKMPKWFV
ncbi:glycosyltransferase family 4 protein [Polynucleobacter nymphae]|uniref:glycosyltransferase family 4 protein n=1 Tax=Polynucleobacter nymphae TaxID=2081043 RepID=UPI001C0DA230|nr:glycosyltransferase [Polynucleobacter nymphae]MBU3607766.1 glycosyltransferase family 4 protein [Polynucleobacter nymphae]